MRHVARLARVATAVGDRRLVGRTFGGWRLESLLGQGRFGSCYRATRIDAAPAGEPDVAALKLLRSEGGSSGLDALWAEAKALSLCAHPAIPRWLGIVREHRDENDRGRRFLSQSLMPGTSLARLLFDQRRTFDAHDLLAIGRQVIDILEHLESRGAAHNDVRPANLLVDETGTVSLVDFGLATFFERSDPNPSASASDRAGLADILLFLLYANPTVSRANMRASKLPWFDDLELPPAQKAFLLDLFADEPVARTFGDIARTFDDAFACPGQPCKRIGFAPWGKRGVGGFRPHHRRGSSTIE